MPQHTIASFEALTGKSASVARINNPQLITLNPMTTVHLPQSRKMCSETLQNSVNKRAAG